MFEVFKSARLSSAPTNNRDYHVTIIGATTLLGRLVVEYFARIVQRSLKWQVVGPALTELQEVESELRLPSNYSLDLLAAASSSELLQVVRRAHVVMCCLDEVKSSLELAALCASEGTHFVGNLETQPSLRRLKGLHFLAKMHSCAIVPLCSRDVTMSELGMWILANSFAPGTLMEASLFRPLPRTYTDMFWDTALLASERISRLTALPSLTHPRNSHTPADALQRRTAEENLLLSNFPSDLPISESPSSFTPIVRAKSETYTHRPTPATPSPLDPIPSITVSLPSESASSTSPSSSDSPLQIRPISSLDNLSLSTEPSWNADPSSSSSGLRSKTKSFDDLDQLSTFGVRILDGATPMRRPKEGEKRRVKSLTRAPLLPSVNQVLQSQKLISQIEAAPKGSTNPVVQQSLETTPTQLCSARDSLAPLVLSSTSLLPDTSQSTHQMEVHHLATIGAGSRLFSALFRIFLFLFLLLPFLRIWIAKWAPIDTNVGPIFGPNSRKALTKEETKAKLRFYASRSPTTLTPSILRTVDPKGDHSRALSRDFTTKNSPALIVGGLGTHSQYLASSSTQTNESLKFVEVSAPGHLGPMHATVVCMCLTALALTKSSASAGAAHGVVPPLSAGGKLLKELLVEEGFKARAVSYGTKKRV